MSLFRPRRADGDRVDVGGVLVRLRVNPRARRVILRLDPRTGEAVAVAPSRARLGDAVDFAASRRSWLAQRVATFNRPVEVLSPIAARDLRRDAVGCFTKLAERHCARLGVPLPRLSVTDTRTRWGSCSPARPGRPAWIRLSWRLMLAPPAIADYVVAHECAHLLEANHGARFWSLVRGLTGDPKPHRAWLRAHGAALHRM